MKKILYSDLDMRFLAHPITGNVKMLNNVDSIKQAIKILVMNNKYEKIYNSNCYTDVPYSLFELIDDPDIFTLNKNIEDTLKIFEPRAQLHDVKIKNDPNNNRIFISIFFRPENSMDTEVVDIFLERLR